ncbi:MAG: metallophosphoesterase [Labilithrix sp.]|nr:metallophosphoesterase [Labilithrix sp.]
MRWIKAGAAGLVVATTGCSLLYSPDDYEGGTLDAAAPMDGAAEAGVDALTCAYEAAVIDVHDPARGVDIYTVSRAEVANAPAAGYTENRGVAFRAATTPSGNRVPVYRVQSPSNGDRIWTISKGEKENLPAAGYTTDEGIAFYANGLNVPCTVPVHGLQRLGRHALAATATELSALLDAGWHDEGIRFYAAPP